MAIFGGLGVDLASGCEEVEEVFAVSLGFLEDIEAGVGFAEVPEIHRNGK